MATIVWEIGADSLGGSHWFATEDEAFSAWSIPRFANLMRKDDFAYRVEVTPENLVDVLNGIFDGERVARKRERR